MASSLFRTDIDLLSRYAAYHRDRRNIATHLVGIPLIVFGLCVLLSRPEFRLGSLQATPIWLVWVATTGWYLSRGHWGLGLAVSGVNGLLMALAQATASVGTLVWLAWGLGTFVLGWVIQFIGHYYEGRKPAFVDDLVGLLVGPMFVTAEVLFSLGWGHALREEIERRAGPTVLRDLAHGAV